MLNFEIKTHRVGITYEKPHFFILNKGLNSGKPLQEPCPNCYVITTQSEEDKNTLFHLTMMLQIAGFYKPFLKGSVIPFITINDCLNVLKSVLNNTEQPTELKNCIDKIQLFTKQEEILLELQNKIAALKISYVNTYIKNTAKQ